MFFPDWSFLELTKEEKKKELITPGGTVSPKPGKPVPTLQLEMETFKREKIREEMEAVM